jgi:hypothetical protein
MVDRNPSQTSGSFGHVAHMSAGLFHRPPDLTVPSGEELSSEVVHHLEALDDVIFAAIDGDQAALQESAAAWHRAVKTLGHDAIEETRRQYLRHAQSVWEGLRHQAVQPPHKILAAIEIIGLLVNAERGS